MSGPVPAGLVFLSDLPASKPGDKVRFLGCVEAYDTAKGNIHLRHIRTETKSPVIEARVNIDQVLDTLSNIDLSVGTWLNVVAYVKDSSPIATKQRTRSHNTAIVELQAVLVWSAGAVNVQAYEQALEARVSIGATQSSALSS